MLKKLLIALFIANSVSNYAIAKSHDLQKKYEEHFYARALKEARHCVGDQLKQYDDGISDASLIASVAYNKCEKKFNQVVFRACVFYDLSVEECQIYKNNMGTPKHINSWIVPQVLEYRKKKK